MEKFWQSFPYNWNINPFSRKTTTLNTSTTSFKYSIYQSLPPPGWENTYIGNSPKGYTFGLLYLQCNFSNIFKVWLIHLNVIQDGSPWGDMITLGIPSQGLRMKPTNMGQNTVTWGRIYSTRLADVSTPWILITTQTQQ